MIHLKPPASFNWKEQTFAGPGGMMRVAEFAMSEQTFTCPRCFAEVQLRPDVRFCPHCGLVDALRAATDTAPLNVDLDGRPYEVLDRVAVGSISTVYRCRFVADRKERTAVFKIARDGRVNDLLANEATVLRRLHGSQGIGKFGPFLPKVEASTLLNDDASGGQRRANVLRVHEAIQSPDELYTLAETRRYFPHGLEGRDVAWIWGRLLSVLGFAHNCRIAHAAVLPDHVLIEPRDHKLVLIDWCGAAGVDGKSPHPPLRRTNHPPVVAAGYLPWYRRQGALGRAPSPGLDVAMGARCMIELFGGDPVAAELPAEVDPALRRYFGRCVEYGSSDNPPDAWRLLDDFIRLIEALWGPRQFWPMSLPPKAKPAAGA